LSYNGGNAKLTYKDAIFRWKLPPSSGEERMDEGEERMDKEDIDGEEE